VSETAIDEAGPHTAKLEECDRLARDWATSVGQDVGSSAYWSVYWMHYFSNAKPIKQKANRPQRPTHVRYWIGERLDTFKEAYARGGKAAVLEIYPEMSSDSIYTLASEHKVRCPHKIRLPKEPAVAKPREPKPRPKKWTPERLAPMLEAFAKGGASAAIAVSPGLSHPMAYYLAKANGVKGPGRAPSKPAPPPPKPTVVEPKPVKPVERVAAPAKKPVAKVVDVPKAVPVPKPFVPPYAPFVAKPLSAMGEEAIAAWNEDLEAELRDTLIGSLRR
jgi:hypothetical protein